MQHRRLFDTCGSVQYRLFNEPVKLIRQRPYSSVSGISVLNSVRFFIALTVIVAGSMMSAPYALAQQTQLSEFDEAVFFFGGRFHQDWFGTSLDPLVLTWDDTYIAAAGYQQTWFDWYDLRLGGEVGISGRFSTDGASAELWGGLFVRYDGLVIADTLRISPAWVTGLSVTTGTQGWEGARMQAWGEFEPVLIYLGAELNFSLVDQPQWETFVRVHHRSGGYGFIADIDASNAITGGVRYKF